MSVPSINILHLTVSKIHPGPNFIGQGDYGKVKGQIKVISCRCIPTINNQCPNKYQFPTHYRFQDTVQTRFDRSRSLQQGQRSNQGHTMMWHNDVAQHLIGQGHYGKVKSRSHHDVAHLQSLTNVPTKYQHPTPHGFKDTPRTKFYRSR